MRTLVKMYQSILSRMSIVGFAISLSACSPKILSGVLDSPSTSMGYASLAQTTIELNPSVVVADGSSTSVVTVTLKDTDGNPVPGKSIVLLSSRGSQDLISQGSSLSDSLGRATFKISSRSAGTTNFSITDATDHINMGSSPTNITFIPGAVIPSQTSMSALPQSLLADGQTTSLVTVTVKDAQGNPVSGKTISLTSNRGASDSILPATFSTNSLGQAIFTLVSTASGVATISATDSTDSLSLIGSVNITFVSGVATAAQSTVHSAPSSVQADGTSISTITVALKDSFGNPAPGKMVTLSSDRGANDTISSASGPSDSSGIVTFTVKSTHPGASTYTATDVTDLTVLTQTPLVTYYVGAVSPSQSTMTASPSVVAANGSTTSTVIVTLKDSSGSPISGKTVTLTSSRGANDTISTSNSTSNALGQVVFTVLSSSVGNAVLTALDSSDSVTLSQTVTVHFYGDLVSNSYLIATPASIPADNSSTSMLTVVLLDSTSTPIPNKTLTLTSSRGALDTITTISGTTNSSGQASFSIKSSKIGFPLFTATDTSDSVVLNKVFRINVLASGSTPQTDYRADIANQGYLPGNNSTPTSTFVNVETYGSSYNGMLSGFDYTNSSGWAGDGSLLTLGALGPNRLAFNGTSSYVNFGSGINSTAASASTEIWTRASNSNSPGKIILSNGDLSGHGLTTRQSWSGNGQVEITLGSLSYAGMIVSLAPVGYWRLGETSGTTVYDSSGNGYHGSYTGSYTQGAPGALPSDSNLSLSLSGSGNVGGIPMPPAGAGSYTMMAWVKPSIGAIISNRAVDSDSSLTLIVGRASPNQAQFYLDQQNCFTGATSTSNITDGNWHQVVGVRSVISGVSTFSIYIDGNTTPEGVNNSSGGNQGCWNSPADSTQPWMIGLQSAWGWGYTGSIDEVATFNYALTPAQINALYNARLNPACTSISPLTSADWSHLTSVFDHSAQTLSLFFNGNQECAINTQVGSTFSGSSVSLSAGASLTPSAAPISNSFWQGQLATVRTYAQALSSPAIQNNYASNAARFDLKKLGAPSPIIWLRADAIQGLADGAPVSNWPDMSSNGNSATQGSPGYQPIYKKNILNGYPVVRFNGGSNFLAAPAVFPTHSDYTQIIVTTPYSFYGPGGYTVMIGSTSNAHVFAFINGNLFFNNNGAYSTALSSTITLNSPYIFSGVYNDASETGSFYVNGSLAGPNTLNDHVYSGSLIIGNELKYNMAYNGDIAEVLIFGTALSANDRALIETYLNAKYGIY